MKEYVFVGTAEQCEESVKKSKASVAGVDPGIWIELQDLYGD